MARHSSSAPVAPRGARPSPPPVRLLVVLGALVTAAVLVLFPFDWLGNVWPAYASVFDVVFATSLSHIIGHATLFFLCGGLLLLAVPIVRAHPLGYLSVMLIGALAQEGIQSLFKLQLPTAWDARDLLLDLTGSVVAYLALLLARRMVPAVTVSRLRIPSRGDARKDRLS